MGILYPPFGTIPDNKDLFVNFESLEEIVDPEYEVESVVYSDDDDDDYVDENAEVTEDVIEANDQSSPVNSDKKRNGDTDTTARKRVSTQKEGILLINEIFPHPLTFHYSTKISLSASDFHSKANLNTVVNSE